MNRYAKKSRAWTGLPPGYKMYTKNYEKVIAIFVFYLFIFGIFYSRIIAVKLEIKNMD